MTGSPVAEVATNAAFHICNISFFFQDSRLLVKEMLKGPVALRRGVAQVAASLSAHPRHLAWASELLFILFSDEDDSVRSEAQRCFYFIQQEIKKGSLDLVRFSDLIANFIDSKDFKNGSRTFFAFLETSYLQLPDVVCRAFERLLEVRQDGFVSPFAQGHLVLRLCSQSPEVDVRRRCLDIIDSLLLADDYQLRSTLDKLEN